MNSTRMRFGFLVLAVYAVLGVIGVYSQAPGAQGQEVCITSGTLVAGNTGDSGDRAHSSSDGGSEVSVEWHSFLPGAFK